MMEKLLNVFGGRFPLKELDVGAFAALRAKGMNFDVKAYEAEGLGHISVMRARGMLGLMRMDTLIVNPKMIDLPLNSYDRILAMGNDTLIVELYDTMAEGCPTDALRAVTEMNKDLPERDAGTHWYDGIKLKESVSTISDRIEALTVKSNEIEELLNQLSAGSNTRADDIEAYQDQLQAINTRIEELKGMRDKLQEQLSRVEMDIQDMDKTIAEATTLKEQALTISETSTVPDDLNELTRQVISSYNDLALNGVNSINTTIDNLNTIIRNINEVNKLITNASDVAEQLYEVVGKAIASSIQRLLDDEPEVLGRYDLRGRPVDKNYKGVTIIRMKNGQTFKINKQ